MAAPSVTTHVGVLEDQISFPLPVDVDREAQLVLGSPSPIYPRNLVLGRDGETVHYDNALNLATVGVALGASLAD